MVELLSFKHFYTVEHRPGEDEHVNYRAHRRRHIGESAECECEDCKCDPCECGDWREPMGPQGGGHSTGKAEKLGEAINEAWSVAARLKQGRNARRNKAKAKLGRVRASRRFASPEKLKQRARRSAYKLFYNKITKGIPKGDLSPQRKSEIEARLQKPAFKGRIEKMGRKLVKDVRKAEMARKRPSAGADAKPSSSPTPSPQKV